MTVIHKKSYNPYFEKVMRGEKKFDLRLADFEVSSGDVIVFEEYDEATRQPTGRVSEHRVGYVLRTKDLNYWTPEQIAESGLVVMQLEDM